MESTRNLALILAVHAGSAFAAEEKSPSSFRQVAIDAASFLRKKGHKHNRNADVAYGPADLPYFGGAEGELCRTTAVQQFENDETIKVKREKIFAVMQTDLYRKAADQCGAEMEIYDRASGLVCLLEKESSYNTTYASFWGGSNTYYGYVYYDGAYDLATMFEYTFNFTAVGSDIGCLADCYTGLGDSCNALETWLTYSGTICKEQYCSLQWAEIDEAYHALRVCASREIAEPSDGMTKEEYVNKARANQLSSNLCGFDICASN